MENCGPPWSQATSLYSPAHSARSDPQAARPSSPMPMKNNQERFIQSINTEVLLYRITAERFDSRTVETPSTRSPLPHADHSRLLSSPRLSSPLVFPFTRALAHVSSARWSFNRNYTNMQTDKLSSRVLKGDRRCCERFAKAFR